MSYTDEYYKALEEERKKKKRGVTSTNPSSNLLTTKQKTSNPLSAVRSLDPYRDIVGSAGLGFDDDDDFAPIKTTYITPEEYIGSSFDRSSGLPSFNDSVGYTYHPYVSGSIGSGTNFKEVARTILGVDYGDKEADPNALLNAVKQRLQQAEGDHGETTKYQTQYNKLIVAATTDMLANTKMDGQEHSILEELQLIDSLTGSEKRKRKEAVIKKMEELGVKKEDYALYTDDSNFTWDSFLGWVNSGLKAGLNSFNKGMAATADATVGNILKGVGWENNPVSKLNDYYSDLYAADKANLDLYTERLGGGAGWRFASDALEGTIGAVPNALLALMTAGQSTAASSSSLATNAMKEAGNWLTKAGITVSSMMKNPQYWLSFARMFGTDYEEAKAQGASETTAMLGSMTSSLINAGIEIGTTGGSGIQGLPDDLLSGNKSKLWSWVESSLEEGGEEMMQKFVSELVTKVAYDHDADILNPSEYLREGAIGAVSGAALGGGQIALDTGVNAYNQYQANKLTEDEQTVLDKVVEEYVAEQENDGKKLTAKEKASYKKNVEERLRRGYVTAEKIEEILGGEDYSSFKAEKDSFLASEDFLAYNNAVNEKKNLAELEQRLEELKNAPNTVGNSKAYDALQSKIEDIKAGKTESDLFAKAQPEALRVAELQKALRAKVRDRVQGTRLEESYRELERRNEKPNLDPSKYTNEAARATVQNIKDSELGDGTNEFADKVEFLARLSAKSGRVYKLMTEEQLKEAGYGKKGYETHGLVDDDGNVLLNYNSSRNLYWTIGHETGHVVEKAGHYKALRKALFNYAIAKEGQDKFNARLAEARETYKNMKNTTPEAEVANDLLGEYGFTDYEFISNLARTERNVFQKIFDEIKSFYKIAVAGSYQQRELEKAKRLFQKALDEVGNEVEKSADGFKFSLENGNKRKYNKSKKSWYSQAETEFLSWQSGSAKVGTVKRFVRNGKVHYYEKTETGCVELSRSQFNERNGANVEDFDRRAERRFGTTVDYDESAERGTLGYSDEYRDSNGDAAVFGETISGKLRNDTAGSVPSAFRYDSRADINQTEYNDEASGEPGASFVTFSNDYQYFRNRMKEGDIGESDAKFSMSKPVEETKDLVALHNLTAEKLLKSLELGGLPMPSVAITKADIPHDNFGDITLILGKESIDPKANKKNVVYSADAWTPTFPQVEYETDSNVERQINRRLSDLASRVEDVFKHDIDMMRYSHEDNLNRYGGEEGLIQYAMEKYGFKAAYLEDQGKHIEKVTEQVLEEKKYNTANEAKYEAIAAILGVSDASEVGKLNIRETIEQYGDQLEAIYPGITKTAMRTGRLLSQVQAYLADQGGEPVYRTVTDEKAMRKAVDDAIDMEGFEAWARELFAGIVKDKGIYNNKDLFTPSGNRRSFKHTHLPFTLENIVKAMASQNQGNTKNVSGFNGIKSLRAGTAERFKSIEAMHKRKGRLQHLTQEEADKINDDLSARLYAIIETIDNENGNQGETNPYIRFDTIGNILMEVSEGGKYNVADIQRVFAEYRRNITDELAADIKQLLFDVTQMPVNIYEAKPERAVGFDEVGVFVIPRNADIKLKQELLNRGYSIAEYDPDVEGDRQKVVNQFEEYKFSLTPDSAELNTPAERGAFNERWSDFGRTDVLDDFAPIREDIAPAPAVEPETVSKTETVDDMFPDDLPSIDEELDNLLQQKEALESRMQEALNNEDYDAFAKVNDEYNSLMARLEELEQEATDMDTDRLSSIDDADAPPVRENEWLDRADVVPLTKKAAQDIARDVRQRLALSNKQMYDVHMLIEEYSRSEFPDREQLFRDIKEKFGTYTESEFDETVKEAKSYLRTYGLFVSDSIKKEIADYAHLMRKNRGRIRFSKEGTEVDVLYHELNSLFPHLFPESIIAPTDQFEQMIEVANMDAETQVEQDLPDDAIWDVADAIADSVTRYQQTQKEKDANKYGRESFNSLMRDADQYAPSVGDDIAPDVVAEPTEAEIAPAMENDIPTQNIAPSEATEPTTANERLAKKLENYENELAKNQQLREQSAIDYDNEIARLQAEYDAKKNKRSLSAHDLLRRIERVKRMKNNVDADYAKRISDLGARIEKLSTKDAKTAAQRQTKMEQHTEKWKNMIGDTSTWKDMALGLSYKTKTLRRILRKVVRGADGKADIALADRIYDELETKYDHNEALLKRESQKVKAVFEKLNLNHAEDTYAHMLGELRHNPETTLTPDVVNDYYKKHKRSIDTKKVDTAITEARKTFDDLLVRVNKSLREQGFKEIPYRKGYFPHFTNPKQGWLAKLLNWKTIDTEVPTSIAGLTETFTPQRSWQSFNKERKGDATDYSLYQGLDTYIHGALDWIYHIDDLQSRRALENHIRYVHSEEGVKARIDEIKANEEYDADEAQALIDGVLKEAENPLSGLVRELMNRTNTLANKKSSMDRGMEDATNRKVYSVMTNLNNRINANMVVGSFSSALTNFIPMVQSWHQVSPYFTVRGLGDMIRSTVRDDGMIAKSDFLTNRLIEEEKLYQTGWDKVTDKAALMMNVIDNITSQTVWRSKYLQNIKEGMSESQAIKDADQFAKNLIAGRSRGNAPTIFDAKNPLVKIATAFQLEVANQYGYMFEDVPQDSKNKARLVKGYATAFMGAYLYNALYSSLVGRDAAFDPISIFEDLFNDLGFGDDDEEEPEDIVLNLVDNILDEVPYVGGLVGGGRIPISSALPYEGDYKTFIEDAFNGEIKVKEMLKPLYYLAMPVGGGQIKKTVEGLGMFDDDLPIAGSYTDSGALRFPVEDTLGNRIQAGMFGQYASQNAREYFDKGYAPMQEKQIQEYIDVDIPIRDYWEYREGLSGLTKAEEKVDYINSLDLPIGKKNILINNQLDRKEKVDLTDYDDYGSLEEFDFAKDNPEKYDFFTSIGVTYQDYKNADEKGKGVYNWAFENPEKYTVSKAVTGDLFKYKQYTSDLYEIRADKDSKGKTISGSAKEKKIAYINGLDIDYGARLILFKDAYPADDTYNMQIIEYLNGRDDFSYEDRVTILKELGFTVTADGTAKWD